MEEKYIATLVLHALGDTIGYNNGKWEFNYFNEQVSISVGVDILCEFISLGGINHINLEDWRVSDDTILHMAIAKSIIKNIDKNSIYEYIKKEIIKKRNKYFKHIYKGEYERHPGITTMKYIKYFEKNKDGRNMPYDKYSGGSGASMRTSCIGLMYYKKENIDDLIKFSIESSKLTHNSAIGYLGGMTSAYFTSLAIRKINMIKWPRKLLKLLKSNKIQKYINEDSKNDHNEFIMKWEDYVLYRFNNGKIIRGMTNSHITIRALYHYERFTLHSLLDNDKINNKIIGSNGFSSVIMAYDALLDAENNWEKIIIYAAFHYGDSDTVAAIACSWYGALYGFIDVPKKNLEYLEFKDKLYKLGEKIYEKYY
jgi:ADP-ribosylarginine hydrolase